MNISVDAPLTQPELKLGFGSRFEDLYQRAGLQRLDAAFLDFLGGADAALRARLESARIEPEALARKEESELLIAVAEHLDDFVARLFGIEAEVRALSARHHELAPLFSCKRLFVQRKAMNAYKSEIAAGFDGDALGQKLAQWFGEAFSELAFARHVADWQKDEAANAEKLDMAMRYAAWAAHTQTGQRKHQTGVLFKAPKKLDFQKLVSLDTCEENGVTVHTLSHLRRRQGFALTDSGTDLVGALDQTNYCIWCHEQGRDSCSRGLKEKAPADGGAAPFKKTVFGVPLAGCPLEERISEFQKLKTEGIAVGALAMITVDNPMVAATGHRICNDCMKSCIYQKQEPVNIPQAETRSLKDVLELPWGFEIYSLLTRWNPLDLRRPFPRPASGRRVLVAGMGPAGFTVAHHLMNDGHSVVGIDGLKIEPLSSHQCGIDRAGARVAFEPIFDAESLFESLDDRVMAGFGGVAEYGITVRWDKNFLKLVRLLLQRRQEFALLGGVRFGGTLSVDDAFDLGFDHVVLAAGAGRPTVLDIPNGLAPGVRTASDFLMALQLTGAAKQDSIANMQLRLPVVVIGGGLTAIDTATESAAYYPLQVEKFLRRFETLCAERGEEKIRATWSAAEKSIAEEFLAHARAIRAERTKAAAEGREPHILELLQSWGGVTIAYRKRLIDSPSYTLNHEEVEKALEEGIRFAENLTPVAVEVDELGYARGLSVTSKRTLADGGTETATVTLPARTVLVAAGTQPNTVLAREDARNFHLDGRYFQAYDESGAPVKPEKSAKPASPQVLLSKRADGRFVSFFGDLHPSFFGNVVKAMGGAKQGYPVVSRVLEKVRPAFSGTDADFVAALNSELRATVHEVIRLTPTIVEVVVRAPLAAKQFQPGQFYRLQNFETLAQHVDGTRLAMEGLALTGAWVDRDKGLVSTIVLEMGGSSDLCALLKPGEPVILMGPTGSPTEIHSNETVVLVGGGLGNAVLFSIGQALRAAGSKVLYFAGYKKMIDRYKVADIEAASDVVVWCCDEAPGFEPDRPDDRAFVGNIVEAMDAYAQGKLGPQAIAFKTTDRIIAIGSDRMMAAVAGARHGVLAAHLDPHHFAIGSINSPMQCMMKEICAQCLQPHVDPASGERTYVFSCFNQDQPLDKVDFPGLAARLVQNSVQEKLTAHWIDRCLKHIGRRPA
ncbi:MAG TPA: FAD-dependent oxidoreductase [Burkholderiales bacterium]|jgi:NADPH-dependent glutamate synthase beta subunit-like oxidoreductase/NAD(P)H-flavin reductase|nr:FAD-dependent oxidoreductase [Burkholderiales bacterium]